VLIAGVPSDERALRNAIAVLLPLELVTAAELPETWHSARAKLLEGHPGAVDVVEAAKAGPGEVAEATRRHLLGAGHRDRGDSA
jgi:hypothetical protein